MYKHAPLDIIAADLLAAALNIHLGVCVTSEVEGDTYLPESIPAHELTDAGHGYSILSNQEDEKLESRLHSWNKYDYETEDHDTSDATSPYWTTSGDDPLIFDQAFQADQVRSKGGWSDAVPDPDYDDKPVVGSLKEARERRFNKMEEILRWLRKSSAQTIIQSWGRFRGRYMEGVEAFKAAGRDTRLLWLTYDQRTVVEKAKRRRLRQLR